MTESKKFGSDDSPVEVIARRLTCENSKFFVYFDHVKDSAGSEVRDYLVVAPKVAGKNLVTGVAILPIANDRVGLIRMYRPAIRAYSWEIPHGFVEEGESDHLSALRELLEETGLGVEPRWLSSLGYITPDAGILAARVHLYIAENVSMQSKAQKELGLAELSFFSVDRFEEMLMSSEVEDTFTIAAWCKYKLMASQR